MITEHQFITVEKEIGKAEHKHGPMSKDLVIAACVLAEESGEVMKAVMDMFEKGETPLLRDHLYEEIAQTAAVCFRMMEAMEDGAYVRRD